MKFNSPLFDSIRVKPDEGPPPANAGPACEWPGCKDRATHRAPKGRDRENEYWRFCLKHVREYNQSYNFFAGMSDDAVLAYQKDALTGHRPTWKMGTGKARCGRTARTSAPTAIRSACSRQGCQRRAAAARRDRPRRCAMPSARHSTPRPRSLAPPRPGQGAVQGAGEAPPSRRQWRRPLDRGPAGRDHPGVQLLEIGRLSSEVSGIACKLRARYARNRLSPRPSSHLSFLHCRSAVAAPAGFCRPRPSARLRAISRTVMSDRIRGFGAPKPTEDQ